MMSSRYQWTVMSRSMLTVTMRNLGGEGGAMCLVYIMKASNVFFIFSLL